ncbi:MAG: hypothetical protein L0Z62_04440 [Gemmataceae bacterium]|nr:hypothetical protein [Gemmataceae bacterium]
MEQRITVGGAEAERIEDTGPTHPRIEPAEFEAALGAEPVGDPVPSEVSLLSLADLGNALLKRLRSSGEPAAGDPNRRCAVPLSPEDVAALGDIVNAIERATGSRPRLGQIASVIVRMHLDTLQRAAGE